MDILNNRLSGNDMNYLLCLLLLGTELETVKYTGGFRMVRAQQAGRLVGVVT